MEGEDAATTAMNLIRSRLCNSTFIFRPLCDSSYSNYSKLKFIVSSSITEACNNSVLLLGPRGSGKAAVLELVIRDLLVEYPDMITVIRLNGLLHSDDNSAFKEIARQLCVEHQLLFSKMASFDDNSQFMLAMLRECGLAHKTILFILDEFDLFTQGKQRLLYSLLDAMQSISSQAVVIGVSCRLDADQLLEKRVKSRFSHRKLLFLPPSRDDLLKLVEHVLSLPMDSSIPHDYAAEFNAKLHNTVIDERFKEIIDSFWGSYPAIRHLVKFLFWAVSGLNLDRKYLSLESFKSALPSMQRQSFVPCETRSRAVSSLNSDQGFISVENFKTALSSMQRQPKMEALRDCSILELYILVSMKRLEVKEQNSYSFNAVMKEYKTIHDSFQTSDYYGQSVCLRAFQHLFQCGLIGFTDGRGHNQSIEFRPVKLLISPSELTQGLKSYNSCPAILLKLCA